METERLGLLSAEWPKAIDIECKTNCLRKFIQQMSMNSLQKGYVEYAMFSILSAISDVYLLTKSHL